MRKRRMRCSPMGGACLREAQLQFGFHFQIGLHSLGFDLSRHPRTGYSEVGVGYWLAPGPSVRPQCYCGYYYS